MIFVNDVDLSGNEKKYLNECIESGWISSEGPFVKRFEQEFSSYIGAEFGVAVTNGTSAIEVALYAAGIGEGDEVILPTFTIISCVVALLRVGAIPVLVDIEPDTWNMDTTLVEENISSKTKAIMPVHIYGHPVDMDPILKLAEKHALIVIEDAAEVHGAEYKEKKCGSIGHLSCFSFYANKLITTGEGGMVLTSNPEFYQRAQSYRNLCFNQQERFLHDDCGYNFRMTNLQAAVGVAQLERIEQIVEKKRTLGRYYQEQLADIPGLKLQVEKEWAKTVYWMYCVQLDSDIASGAQEVTARLADRKIGTRPFFRGMHDQPALMNKVIKANGSFPVADMAYKKGFYLPSGLNLDFKTVDTVCENLKSVLNEL